MHQQRATQFCLVLLSSATVIVAQGNPPNLSAVLSAAQGLASILGPTTSSSTVSSLTSSNSFTSTASPSSSSSSSTSSTSTTSTPTTTSSPTASTISSAAAISSGSSSGASTQSSGIDPHTRDIILGVTIPVGLLLLAAIIFCLFLCCRRRRRSRRTPSPESQYIGNKDWEHGDTSHHGYNSNSSLRTGHSNGIGNPVNHDAAPLIGATHHHHDSAMSEHHRGPHMFTNSSDVATNRQPTIPVLSSQHNPPAYELNPGNSGNPNVQNPFTPAPPIARKPVPDRGSTGSNISGVGGHNADKHRSTLGTGAAVGAGALVGAAAMHHHDKHRHSEGDQHKPESIHRPLASHPHEAGMYATASPVNDHPYRGRPSTPPFSPDDVGSMHRRSQRFSHGITEPGAPVPHSRTPEVPGGIIAPTVAQRRSLQSRNSSYSDGRDTSRGPSRSPRRRSLTGGGEMWQTDSIPPPALPSQSRHNSGEFQHAMPAVAAVRPNRNRHDSSESRLSNAFRSPALPSNRHIGRSRKPHLYHNVSASNTDSSTSNDSWESAQAELDPWDDRDTGRYPRFSNGSTNSSAPLMAPSAAWNDSRERRWSGDIFNSDPRRAQRYSVPEPRRNSGGMERRRLRFSEGGPEYYNEQGLVGRAL